MRCCLQQWPEICSRCKSVATEGQNQIFRKECVDSLEELGQLVGRVPDSWLKGGEFESQQEWQDNFSSQEWTLCALIRCLFHLPMLPQWHIKDPSHSAKSAGGRLLLNMDTSLTQWSQSGLTMLSWHSVGTYQETSSNTTHQETLSHSHLCLLSHCGLILA